MITSGEIPFLAMELVGQSPAALRVRELVRRAAPGDNGVLLVGETGTDCASVAREIHDRRHREPRPWVMVACAEPFGPPVEHRLFGTPVSQDRDLVAIDRDGAIARARHGTLFLQDVTELPAGLQARLVRLLRDGEARQGDAVVPLEVRLVASADPAVDDDLRDRRFRQDLYRRVATSRIDVPSLRERAADIAPMADRLLHDVCHGAGVPLRSFTHASHALLSALSWPRNLSELRAVVEQVVTTTETSVIQIEHLLPVVQIGRGAPAFAPGGTLRDARRRFEREYIGAVLQHHAWQLGDAARTLGIQRPNLYRKARQLGIPLAKQSA